MRIIIDLQACQSTGSRHRGIGRYSLSLAKEMIKNASKHEVHLLLNSRFLDTLEVIKKEFDTLVPTNQFHLFGILGKTEDAAVENFWRARAGELIREQALQNLKPDIVHVSSLFEGFGDAAITSINQHANKLSTAVTLYDLIPYIHRKDYLDFPPLRAWYLRKAQSLKAANLALAISESSRQEGINWLHMPPERIVNISSGVDSRFIAASTYDRDAIAQLQARYQLIRPYIMYTGGIDLRKNIERLIQAFAALPSTLRLQYQLAIVCSIQDVDRKRLKSLAAHCGLQDIDLVLTGFVPDDDLPALYQHCELFVFPSWHEGFGLPALEAMASGAATIASNTSSLPEVIGWDEATFDPYHVESITKKIYQALTDHSFKRALIEHGKKQVTKFSWEQSAKKAIDAFEQNFEEKNKFCSVSSLGFTSSIRYKLAYFSPLPNDHSGIADYSAELLPELAAYYEITLISDVEKSEDAWLNANFDVRSHAWFEQNHGYFDRIIYHIGNSAFHTKMYDLVEKYPGVVVLHDFFLSGLIAYLDASQVQPGIFARELYASHGYSASIELQSSEDFESIVWKYPCNLSLINHAEGIIVHSEFSKKLADEWYGRYFSNKWKKIPLLRCSPAIIERESARCQLGFGENDFVVCSFGIVGPTKLNLELLEAWLDSPLATDNHCHLILVGRNDGNQYGQDVASLIKRSEGQIKITGFTELNVFRQYLAAADVAVQLRGISRGETSAAILDCLAYGVPTIANKNGATNELPDDVFAGLPDTFTRSELKNKLFLLRSDHHLRAKISSRAKEYIRKYHTPGKIGHDYFQAIENFFSQYHLQGQQQTLKRISALSTSVTVDDDDLLAVAQALANNPNLKTQPSRIFLALDNFLQAGEQTEQIIHADILRSFLNSLRNLMPKHLRIEPVLISGAGERIRSAKKMIKSLFLLKSFDINEQIVDVRRDDILVNLVNTSLEPPLSQCVWPTGYVFNKRISFNFNVDVKSGLKSNHAAELGALFLHELCAHIDEENTLP